MKPPEIPPTFEQAEQDIDYTVMNAIELSEAVRRGEASPEAIVQQTLDKIGRTRAELGEKGQYLGVTELPRDHIGKQLAELNEKLAAGNSYLPLAGVTIGVKELNAIKGLPLRYGTPKAVLPEASETSITVQRLMEAGAIVVCWTDSAGFGAQTDSGEINSTADGEYGAGNSSSGSAQAVALGLVRMATSSDAGGSDRNPGSRNDRDTFKSSSAEDGVEDAWGGKAAEGILAATIEETALGTDITSGRVPGTLDSLVHAYNNPNKYLKDCTLLIEDQSIFGDISATQQAAMDRFKELDIGIDVTEKASIIKQLISSPIEFNQCDVILAATGVVDDFDGLSKQRAEQNLPPLDIESVGPLAKMVVNLGRLIRSSGKEVEAIGYVEELRSRYMDLVPDNMLVINFGRRQQGDKIAKLKKFRKFQRLQGRALDRLTKKAETEGVISAQINRLLKSEWLLDKILKLGTGEMECLEEMTLSNALTIPAATFRTLEIEGGIDGFIHINGPLHDGADQKVMALMALLERSRDG